MRFSNYRSSAGWALILGLAAWQPPSVHGTLFYSRPTFELGSEATTDVTFDDLAGPPSFYTAYPAGLTLAGVGFRGTGPGEPPSGSLFVIDPLYHDDYNRGSGDVLSPGIADGKLTIELPPGVTAVGFDVATFGGAGANHALVVASSGGPDPLLIFGSVEGPESGLGFVGFSSTAPIVRVTITPSAWGITLIDNLRFGQLSAALAPGDANGDGVVDGSDFTLWADHYLQVGRSFDQGDFNGDGIVDSADYTLWADHYSVAVSPLVAGGALLTTATPEPATWALAACGAVVVAAAAAIKQRGNRRIALTSEDRAKSWVSHKLPT